MSAITSRLGDRGWGVNPYTHAAMSQVPPPPPVDQKKANPFATGAEAVIGTSTMTSSTGSQKTMLGQ